VRVSHRPLAIVTGLTIGDYLLWNWSLNANHDVLALVSGLTLPPMTIAFLWLVALTVARLVARTSRASAHNARAGGGERAAAPNARGWRARRALRRAPGVAGAQARAQPGAAASPTSTGTSRKIAA
jgi:hypothetical protein